MEWVIRVSGMRTDDYMVGMADFSDIKAMTKGTLAGYLKIRLSSEDQL